MTRDELPGIFQPPTGKWRIDISTIPTGANYTEHQYATILRLDKEDMWHELGYLLLSTNPGCSETLRELVKEANAYQQIRER